MAIKPRDSLPRIGWDELPADLRELLNSRVERLGYLGEFFQLGAHQPAALNAFIRFTGELKAALPWNLVEAIALNVAATTGNAYEQAQHERLALNLGLPGDLVEAHVHGSAASHPDISRDEAAAAELARSALAAYGQDAGGAFERLRSLTSDAIAVGCLMLTARYVAHSTMVNAWALRPPVASPLGDRGRGDGR